MDFDTEAADDYYRAVKAYEDELPDLLACAGADSDDCESDTGLLTPPPDYSENEENSCFVPPPRPTYSDSWVRIMKKRVEEGYTTPDDTDSDTSSVISSSNDNTHEYYTNRSSTAIVSHDFYVLDATRYGGLATSADSIAKDVKEGSTATLSEAEDLLAEMLDTYTVPKHCKAALRRSSHPKRKRSSSSNSKQMPAGIVKRISRWPKTKK